VSIIDRLQTPVLQKIAKSKRVKRCERGGIHPLGKRKRGPLFSIPVEKDKDLDVSGGGKRVNSPLGGGNK